MGVGLVLAGCGARGPEMAGVREPGGEAARGSCRASAPARRLALQLGDHRVEVGGRSFVHGWWREGMNTQTVLIGVDAVGEPLIVPLPLPPGDPLAIGADAQGIVIVSVPRHGTGVMVRVVVDGAVKVGAAMAVPEIGWGWPRAIAVKGSRALVSHTLATAQQGLGEEVIYTVDLEAGRVLASLHTGAQTQCAAGACTTLVEHEGTARVVRRTPDGEMEMTVPLTSGCPMVYEVGEGLLVLPGAPWRALEVVGEQLRTATVANTLAPVAKCEAQLEAQLTEFPSRRWPGLVSHESLLRWEAEKRSFGAAEGLPRVGFGRVERFEHADGVIEIGWKGGSRWMHSEADAQGRSVYTKRWYYERGQVRLLRREGGGFVASDAVPLALTLVGADRMTLGGYVPTLLRHGLHAVVLIAAQGEGAMSWWQPYLRPCESG